MDGENMNILAQSVGRIDMPATNTDYDSELLPRLEASNRIETACQQLLKTFDSAGPNLRSWATSSSHDFSTPLQLLEGYLENIPDGRLSCYEEELQAIRSLREEMERFHWILSTLSPVTVEAICADNPKVPSAIWAAFGTLIFLANPEEVGIMLPEQRGIFTRDDIMCRFHEILTAIEFGPALHWMSSFNHFVSSYAAEQLSGLYETLADLLGYLVEVQIRALGADEEYLSELKFFFLENSNWIQEQLALVKQSGQVLSNAVADEKAWRDGVLKATLDQSEKLAGDGDLDQACQVMERIVDTLAEKPPCPPPGVDVRQLEFLARTRLHELYRQGKDVAKIASEAWKLHNLTREILGPKSKSAISKSSMYAMHITEVKIANATARDILLTTAEAAEEACDQDDQTLGMVNFLLGRTIASLGDTDQGLVHLTRALGIFEKNLSEDTYTKVDSAADLISSLLDSQGRCTEACDIARRVRDASSSRLGPTHAFTAKRLVDLGFAELGRGHPDDAEAPLLRAIEILNLAEDGLAHHEMQRALGNLMSVYTSQRRYEDCVRIGRRLLPARERVLGPTAWLTLMTMAKLGRALTLLGNMAGLDEAREMLLETRRRLALLEESEGPGSGGEISDMVTEYLWDLAEKSGERQNAEDHPGGEQPELRHAEERVARLDLTEGALLQMTDANAVNILITMYLANNMPDKAFQLVQKANKTVAMVQGTNKVGWKFNHALDSILYKMTTCTDEFVNACREEVGSFDTDQPWKPEYLHGVQSGLTWGTALLRAGREAEGVDVLQKCMERSEKLEKDGSLYYRIAFERLYQHYTREMLVAKDVDVASRSPEFWDKLIMLVKPKAARY